MIAPANAAEPRSLSGVDRSLAVNTAASQRPNPTSATTTGMMDTRRTRPSLGRLVRALGTPRSVLRAIPPNSTRATGARAASRPLDPSDHRTIHTTRAATAVKGSATTADPRARSLWRYHEQLARRMHRERVH